MARWLVGRDARVEYRWFGRWSTPAWLDYPQARNRGLFPAIGLRERAVERLSDWLRRWAVTMHEVS